MASDCCRTRLVRIVEAVSCGTYWIVRRRAALCPGTKILRTVLGCGSLSAPTSIPHAGCHGNRFCTEDRSHPRAMDDAPGYPGVAPGPAGVAALRADPTPLADLGVRDVLDHLAEIIDELAEPPILM